MENQNQNTYYECTKDCIGECNHATGQCNCIDFCNEREICNQSIGLCNCIGPYYGNNGCQCKLDDVLLDFF